MEEIIILETSKLVATSQPIKNVQKEDTENLFRSISEVGLLYPLLVRPIKGGKYEVLDGRTRLEVLRKIGCATVKCIVRRDEEVRDEIVPYDVEIYRRHLTKKEIADFEKIRKEKKQEAERDVISHLIRRLPRKFQRQAEKYVETIPDVSRKLYLNLLATMAESDLEDFFERSECAFNYSKLVQEVTLLKKEKEELEARQEEEVEKRIKEFEQEFKERFEQVKKRGLVIPKDPDEKTTLMKEIEDVVREEMREEFEQIEKVQEKNKQVQLDLTKKLSEKEEELRKLKGRNDDLEVQIGMLDDIRKHFNIMLNKSIDIKPIIAKTRVFCSDLDAFSRRLVEWHNRPNVAGRGVFKDMTEENIFLLKQELDILKKKFSEIKSLLA